MPKHQWIVSALLANDQAEFDRRMDLVEAECDENIHTIVLSTEGVFTHWWDYTIAAKQWFSRLSTL